MLEGVRRYFRELKRRNKLIAYGCMRLFRSPKVFSFDGRTYTYFWHRYNATWRSERAIEIPIFRHLIRASSGARILEVGNVLSHYGPLAHEVMDKYEKVPGVLNEDVCTFNPGKQYDLIVSMSTLEHVGRDETPKEPEKILKAFENLRRLLAPGGRIVVSLPLGSNPAMDRWIEERKISFTRCHYLHRVSPTNEWRETGWQEARAARYDDWLPTATGLLVGIIEG